MAHWSFCCPLASRHPVLFFARSLILALVAMPVQIAVAQTDAEEVLLLGTIDFPTSGNADGQEAFRLGVLALHSFWYAEARDQFMRARELDPRYGMTYWGEAMTYDNAFLTEHGSAEYEKLGEEVIARMDVLDAAGDLTWTERERGYANAMRWRFAANYSFAERRQGYLEAMEALSLRYPDDDEATVFAALALMALPGFNREQPVHVVTVAGYLEQVYERNRQHPGALHYLIHVYDTKTYALMGLRQARIYAGIAPASSHALHMPSHIFRHLGMWEEVASSNEDAYAASVAWQEQTGRPLHMRDYHALDWLLDAYLKLDRLEDAKRLLDELDQVEAEISNRGEDPGQFSALAESMRSYYRSAVQ